MSVGEGLLRSLGGAYRAMEHRAPDPMAARGFRRLAHLAEELAAVKTQAQVKRAAAKPAATPAAAKVKGGSTPAPAGKVKSGTGAARAAAAARSNARRGDGQQARDDQGPELNQREQDGTARGRRWRPLAGPRKGHQ